MPKINKPSLNGIYTRVCLGKRIITSIIRIAHTSHNPAVSLGTAGACDKVEQIFPSNYGNGITQTQIRTCVLGLTSQHCR